MPPGFDRAWRRRVLVAAATAIGGEALSDGGVYWQAIGPRFETPAEIRMMAAHADLVGMTIASECVIAGELGLPYAALCMVDNLANGIGSTAAQRRRAGSRPRRQRGCACATPSTRLLPELGVSADER